MPTASRLVAALCLVVLAFIVSGMIIDNGEEGKDYGYFTYVNMALGAVCGWTIMGKRAGRGWTAGINNGLTGVASLVFLGLVRAGVLRDVPPRHAQQIWRSLRGGSGYFQNRGRLWQTADHT